MTTTAVKPGLSAAFASPYTPIGYVNGTPVYPIGGARSGGGIEFAVGDDSGDDPRFADEVDDDDDDDDQDEPDEDERPTRGRRKAGDDDWAPPSREQVERMEQALRKANAEAAKRRTVGKTMQQLGIDDLPAWLAERGIDPSTGQPYGSDVVDPADLDDAGQSEEFEPEERPTRRGRERSDREIVRQVRAAEQRGRSATVAKLTPILAQQYAESAFRDAGFDGSRDELDLVLRMIDARQVDVEIDDDGFEVIGVDEQIEEIKDRMPRLFKPDEPEPRRRQRSDAGTTRRKSGAAAVDGGTSSRRTAKPMTWAERAFAQMEGKMR